MNFANRILEIQRVLNNHNYRYYVLSDPIISDGSTIIYYAN
jgi:NAD-dependent DNA ligase